MIEEAREVYKVACKSHDRLDTMKREHNAFLDSVGGAGG